MAKKKGEVGIVEALREAVRDAERRGVTRYQIAKNSGVSESQLSKLMATEPERHRVPRLDTAEKIAAGAGFKLAIETINNSKAN